MSKVMILIYDQYIKMNENTFHMQGAHMVCSCCIAKPRPRQKHFEKEKSFWGIISSKPFLLNGITIKMCNYFYPIILIHNIFCPYSE